LATLANVVDSMALCYQGSGGLVMRAARTQQHVMALGTWPKMDYTAAVELQFEKG
jgi:hypothetical protein